MELPEHGLDRDTVFTRLDAIRDRDLDWRGGKAYAYVYEAGDDLEAVGHEAFQRFLTQNGLDPTVFPSALELENDVVGILCDHLGGGEEATGAFTSGGTESIMLAVKAARDYARAHRPEVARPEVLLPTTAHPAFHKAAHYLGLEVVSAEVDPETFAADPDALARAVTPSTILLVGSAPSYAHGVIDPIPALGALAREEGLLLHVDACVGGWLLPYYRRLGVEVPDFDLSVPGVTSLSVDLHKYGFCPKGASTVLYSDASLRRYQAFACTEWTGYSVVNQTVQNARSVGPLAAAWAVVHHLGDAGYERLARETLEGTRTLVAGIEAIPGLDVLGRPDFCLVAASSDEVSVFHVVDEMRARGWYVQPQLSYGHSPASVHFSLSPGNASVVERLLADLRDSVAAARELPSGELARTVSATLAELDPAELPARMPELLALAGVEGTRLPERMAGVHELLDALPRELCKHLLVEFMGWLYTPTRGAVAGVS